MPLCLSVCAFTNVFYRREIILNGPHLLASVAGIRNTFTRFLFHLTPICIDAKMTKKCSFKTVTFEEKEKKRIYVISRQNVV